MSVSGGIQGLHFINSMSNAPLQAGATQAKGIVSGLAGSIKTIAPFAPLAAAGVIFAKLSSDALKFSKEFENAMKEIETISKATQDNFKGISEEIVNMAANGPDNANELAKGFYQIVSAGYDGAEGLKILDTSSKLATASLTSVFTAADTLTSILNAYGDEAGNVTSISDKLFEVVKNGKTTMEELGQNIGNVTGLAAQAGLKLDDLFTAYSTGTKTLKTAEFTTAIRGFLTAVIKPSDDAIAVAKDLGIEFNTTALATKGLSGFLQELIDKSKGNIETLSSLFPNVRGLNGVLAIGAENGSKFAEQLENIEKAAGNTEKALSTMLETVDNKWKVVGNKWNRELKELGDTLKLTSGGIADFLNAVLTDREADVVKPGIDKIVENVKEELKEVNDAEKQREIITQRIIALRDEYNAKANTLRGYEENEKPSWLLPRMGQEWRTFDAVVKSYENDMSILRRAKTEIEKLYSDVGNFGTDDDGGPKDPEIIKGKTVSDALNKIKELEEKLGTGSIEMDVDLILKINEEQAFIDNVTKQVREKLSEALSEKLQINLTDDAGKNVELKGQPKAVITDQTNETKKLKLEIDKIINGNTVLSAKEKERLELLQQQYNILHGQQTLIETLSEGFMGASEILGALSFAAGELDQSLGTSIGKMADIAYNASSLVKNLGEGGSAVTAISSAIAIIGTVAGMLNEMSSTNKANQLEALNQLYDIQNRKIEEQIELLQQLEGDDRLEKEKAIKEELQKQLDLLNVRANTANIETEQQESHLFGLIKKWGLGPTFDADSVEDLKEILDSPFLQQGLAEGTFRITNMAEIEAILAEYDAIMQQMDDFDEETKLRRIGFDTSAVADSIFQGIQDGLQLSGSELGDWSENFGNLIKKSLSKNILESLNNQFLIKFMEDFNTAMEDGNLSEGERNALQDLYIESVNKAQQMWDDIQPILSEYTAGSETDIAPLTGAIKGMTEDQASLLAGQFTAMRFDLKDISFSMDEQLGLATDSLEVMEQIRDNTAYNVNLVQIQKDINEMNQKIQRDL